MNGDNRDGRVVEADAGERKSAPDESDENSASASDTSEKPTRETATKRKQPMRATATRRKQPMRADGANHQIGLPSERTKFSVFGLFRP